MKKINKFVYLNLLLALLASNQAMAFGPKKEQAKPAATQPAPAPKPTPAPKVVTPATKSPAPAVSNPAPKVSHLPIKPTTATKPEDKPVKVSKPKSVSKPKPVQVAKPKSPVTEEKPIEVAEVKPVQAPKSEAEKLADGANELFGKFKNSIKNGATNPVCDAGARALNQC